MASSHNANTPKLSGKDAMKSPNTSAIKQDAGGDGALSILPKNATGPRNHEWHTPLFASCFACQTFSTYRAYGIYQSFDTWDVLNGTDQFYLVWGVVSMVVMTGFTAAYVVAEYREMQSGKKKKA
ncbi:hypothetical protein VE02_09620 [Pseudogymnoascus sp. 03VT05]|nr:hypothetical protein VE02_09620 [Pseudogymnoascus sp. 03VT05]